MRGLFGVVTMCVTLGAQATAQRVAGSGNPDRAALEQQFRQRTAKLAQQKLGLTDAQLTQLEQTSARYNPQLNRLLVQERETRRQLRLEMSAGSKTNQQHVSALLDSSISFQKQRIAIVESEQKDLARFLTPSQRAGYIALQSQIRRRAQELARGKAPRPRNR